MVVPIGVLGVISSEGGISGSEHEDRNDYYSRMLRKRSNRWDIWIDE